MNKLLKIRLILLALLFTIPGLTAQENNFKPYNILWLTCEDISPMLSSYGDSTAKTPVLDQLASESLVFTNMFATVGVCAPSRSSLITGVYPISMGTLHMRTGQDVFSWGKRDYEGGPLGFDINGDTIPLYSAVIPDDIKCFTEYLRADNYYCTNNAKTDYQFASPVTAWDENNDQAHWQNAPENMPFFSVFNHGVTHESMMWRNKDKPLTVDPDKVPLPDYFPDTDTVRTDVARCYSNIELLDEEIGLKLKELEEAGLLDNTIIFFFSDHGGPLPRGKREHLDSGLKVPFLVRFPNAEKTGVDTNLHSFVDLAPTILSLAGIKPPEYMQGKAFLGKYKEKSNRKYIYGSGDRFDEFSDRIRSVRDHRYMYVRNYHPELPRYKDVGYRKNMDMMNELLRLNNDSKLNAEQSLWFETSKPKEELYDCLLDPYQLNNIISNEIYASKVEELSSAMDNWQKSVVDKGAIPEKQLLEEMWPRGKQPKTAEPLIKSQGEHIVLSCTTKGASIAYLVSDKEMDPDLNSGWKLYTKPLKLINGELLYTLANRIGFADSEIKKYKY